MQKSACCIKIDAEIVAAHSFDYQQTILLLLSVQSLIVTSTPPVLLARHEVLGQSSAAPTAATLTSCRSRKSRGARRVATMISVSVVTATRRRTSRRQTSSAGAHLQRHVARSDLIMYTVVTTGWFGV